MIMMLVIECLLVGAFLFVSHGFTLEAVELVPVELVPVEFVAIFFSVRLTDQDYFLLTPLLRAALDESISDRL